MASGTLLRAVESGRTVDVLELLRRNEHTSQDLCNAIGAAVASGQQEIVGLLVDAGADPNCVPRNHLPPLFSAIEHHRVDIIALLVKLGADVNLRINDGQTPLLWAIDVEGDLAWQTESNAVADISGPLLSLGADPSVADAAGVLPIDLARRYGHLQAVELLLIRR